MSRVCLSAFCLRGPCLAGLFGFCLNSVCTGPVSLDSLAPVWILAGPCGFCLDSACLGTVWLDSCESYLYPVWILSSWAPSIWTLRTLSGFWLLGLCLSVWALYVRRLSGWTPSGLCQCGPCPSGLFEFCQASVWILSAWALSVWTLWILSGFCLHGPCLSGLFALCLDSVCLGSVCLGVVCPEAVWLDSVCLGLVLLTDR
jgi:uncharacterized membrane protein YhaH (DUF805 family)